MRRIIILIVCIIPVISYAQNNVLVLEKNNMHVKSFTIGDPMTFKTVYGQWFVGTIDDLRHDTVYISGQAFSYKEIAAIKRDHSDTKYWGTAAITVGLGVGILGAFNGARRGDKASTWYTASGIVLGSALIGGGLILVATPAKQYTLGGKFQLQYLQIGRR
jgi:hypothetical protein